MAAQEKVGILIELENADEALKTLQGIDRTVRELGRKKTMIKLDDGSVESIDDRIKKIQDRLTALRAAKRLNLLDDGEVEEMKRLNSELDILKRGLRDGMAQARTFKQVFNGISSKVAHAGSAMQSFGNALTQLTSPFSRITDGMLLGAGYKVLNSFTEGLESGFTRYDTMKKYPKMMAQYSTETYTAEQSIQDLNKAVEGMPIALDDAVSLAQRYTLSLGDMERGTQLAIATNNAFLASMATESQRYQGMMQMQDLLNGKKLNSREWMSLGASMGKAINEIGKELKYTDLGQFRQDLYGGKIATEDFLDALQKVGTGKGSLVALAEESKDTWEAFFSRVGTAASRMVYGTLKALDAVSKAATGKDVNQLLDDVIIPSIDNATKSVTKWIKAHPDEITDFFRDLKRIDVGSFLKGFAKGIGDVAKVIDFFAKLADKVGGLGSLGRFMGFGRFLGKASTVFGGLLKGTRHIWGGLGVAGTFIGSKIGGKLGKSGIFGKIVSIFGKKKDIEMAEETAKTIPSVADTFKGVFSALQGLMTTAGAVLIVSGTGFVAFKAAKSILKDLKEMTDLVNGGGWNNVGYVGAGVITAIGVFTEIFNAVGTALGPQGLLGVAIASAASVFVTGAFAGDMWLIKQGVIQIRDTILELDNVASAITNMKGIGTLDDNIKEKFRTTIDAINEIKNMLVGKSGSIKDQGQVEAGIPIFTNFRVTALNNIADALKQMQRIVEQFNLLSELTLNDPSQILEDLKTACDKLQGIRGPKNIEKHTEKVAEALIQVRRMAYHINKLAGTDVNVAGFGNFVQQIKDALADFKELSGELMLDIEVKLSPLFGSSVEGVKKNIREAKRDIERLKKPPIAFSIPVTVTFSVTSNLASALAQIRNQRQSLIDASKGNSTTDPNFIGPPRYPAMGGAIYRKRGGNVGFPGRPRGTDRVPAWLSAGEFVQNKRAVSTFGIDFMRKVNNLDIKGAMNELMHRAGHMANINRGTTITNNNYNNQKVVINNNGSTGAGFTFKRASRFVGAL